MICFSLNALTPFGKVHLWFSDSFSFPLAAGVSLLLPDTTQLLSRSGRTTNLEGFGLFNIHWLVKWTGVNIMVFWVHELRWHIIAWGPCSFLVIYWREKLYHYSKNDLTVSVKSKQERQLDVELSEQRCLLKHSEDCQNQGHVSQLFLPLFLKLKYLT